MRNLHCTSYHIHKELNAHAILHAPTMDQESRPPPGARGPSETGSWRNGRRPLGRASREPWVPQLSPADTGVGDATLGRERNDRQEVANELRNISEAAIRAPTRRRAAGPRQRRARRGQRCRTSMLKKRKSNVSRTGAWTDEAMAPPTASADPASLIMPFGLGFALVVTVGAASVAGGGFEPAAQPEAAAPVFRGARRLG